MPVGAQTDAHQDLDDPRVERGDRGYRDRVLDGITESLFITRHERIRPAVDNHDRVDRMSLSQLLIEQPEQGD